MTILNPAGIFKSFQEGKLDKEALTKTLIHIIENESDELLREDSLKIFKVLEETIITDWSAAMKIRAAKWLLRDFPKRCVSPIKSLDRSDNFPILVFDLIWKSENPLFDEYKEELYSRIERNIQEHVNNGIVYEDAFVLVLMEKLYGSKLEKITYNEGPLFRDMWYHYKVSRDGHIIGFYFAPHSDPYEFYFVPESIGQLKYLEEFEMIGSSLEMIPESIGELKSLKRLSLGVNSIRAIPESIGKLISLEKLDLIHNNIRMIPESIGNLKSLKVLDLVENKIKVIPESLGDLQTLERLNLGWNNIKRLPSSLSKLKNLKVLNLKGNNIKSIPKSLKFIKTTHI